MDNLFFVDVESTGPCPGLDVMTEFAAVHYVSRDWFHGVLFGSEPTPGNPGLPRLTGTEYDPEEIFLDFEDWIIHLAQGKRPTFISDNPAFDFQWINYGFYHAIGRNPFGYSARRIGDFYAGLTNNFSNANSWKKLRVTKHDHNPVNDVLGNAEAFERILRGER